jgi:hypothetical protein
VTRMWHSWPVAGGRWPVAGDRAEGRVPGVAADDAVHDFALQQQVREAAKRAVMVGDDDGKRVGQVARGVQAAFVDRKLLGCTEGLAGRQDGHLGDPLARVGDGYGSSGVITDGAGRARSLVVINSGLVGLEDTQTPG